MTDPILLAQLHITINETLDSEHAEELEDQLAFVLGALGLHGTIYSSVTWNETAFPLDYESEDQVNESVISEVVSAVEVEYNRSDSFYERELDEFAEREEIEAWYLEGRDIPAPTPEQVAAAIAFLRTPDEDDNSDEDGLVRDLGDYIREEEERDLE